MSKRLPLHDAHQAAGATFKDLLGWQIVERFSSVDSEYAALQDSAGLIDLSFSGIVELKGDDRTRFLHGMVTNDVKSLTPGKGCYAAFLTPQGRMTTDLRVFCSADSLLLTTEPTGREKLAPALRKYIIGDRPLLLDRSEELALLSLQGPKATQVLGELLSAPRLPSGPYDHFTGELDGAVVRICHVRRTIAGGWDLIVGLERVADVWDLILEKGKKYGVQPAGFDSLDTHRVEAGIPWYGLDMDESTLPIEAGLEKDAISFNKGCYIGQESVARITYRGHVNRKLVGLTLSSIRPALNRDAVSKDGQEVGWVTSSVYSPRVKAAIALGYLRREVLQPGNQVVVGKGDGQMSAQVTALPFTGSSV